MQSAEVLAFISGVLEDTKARDVDVLDVKEMTSITDYMIVCSATSQRHAKTVAEHLVVEGKKLGLQPLGVEGMDSPDWILIDFDHAIIHVMLPATREFYSLEKLWSASEKYIKSMAPKKA